MNTTNEINMNGIPCIYSEEEWDRLPNYQSRVAGTLYYMVYQEKYWVEIRQVYSSNTGAYSGTAALAQIRKGAGYFTNDNKKHFVITIEQSPQDYFENTQNTKFHEAVRHVIQLIDDEKIL